MRWNCSPHAWQTQQAQQTWRDNAFVRAARRLIRLQPLNFRKAIVLVWMKTNTCCIIEWKQPRKGQNGIGLSSCLKSIINVIRILHEITLISVFERESPSIFELLYLLVHISNNSATGQVERRCYKKRLQWIFSQPRVHFEVGWEVENPCWWGRQAAHTSSCLARKAAPLTLRWTKVHWGRGDWRVNSHIERRVLGKWQKCKKITRWVFKHLKHTPKTLSTIKFEGGGTTPLISKQIRTFVFWVEDQLSLRFRVCDSIKGFQRIREVCSVLLFSALHCTDLQFET